MRWFRTALALGAIWGAAALGANPVQGQCQLAKLRAPDAAPFDEFGVAVAISGPVLVVGTHRADEPDSDTGAAYVYRFSGAEWTLETKLIASDATQNDLFGAAVAVSGEVIVVGAYAGVSLGTLRGAAYVYRRVSGVWIEEAILLPPVPALNDAFGYAVAIDGDRIAVGDPGNPIFGSPPGRVFVYERVGGAWALSAVLSASDGALDDDFGAALALRASTIIVGAPARAAAAGAEQGGAYVFEFDGVDWTETPLVPAAGTAAFRHFGAAVGIDGGGARAAVGDRPVAPGAGFFAPGRVTLFEAAAPPPGAWNPVAEIASPDGDPADAFGSRIVLAADRLVVSAADADRQAGRVYDFDLPATGGWVFTESIEAADGAASDHFGADLDLSETTLVVSAPNNDDDGASSGCVYVYFFEPMAAPFRRGDANGDASIDIGDAVWLLSYTFLDGRAPPCMRASDANGDASVDVGDPIFLLNHLLLGGPAPPVPYPNCGVLGGAASPLCCVVLPDCP